MTGLMITVLNARDSGHEKPPTVAGSGGAADILSLDSLEYSTLATSNLCVCYTVALCAPVLQPHER